MIEQLLPPPAEVAEAFRDNADDYLFPAERRLVERAVGKRHREFATTRACARRALGRLGVAPAPILQEENGAPVWPSGIVGSMTHCAGYRAAAVARAGDLVAVGIDAEPNMPIGDRIREVVTVPRERDQLRTLRASRPEVCWDRLVFSAKESVYKAWYPLTGRWLDFHEAVVTVDPDSGTFQARLLVPGPVVGGGEVQGFDGSWLLLNDILLTAIALPRTATNATPMLPLTGRALGGMSAQRGVHDGVAGR